MSFLGSVLARPLNGALPVALLVLPAAGQTIVDTGDDLAAICAAAADGSVIEIHSDAVFVGTLTWSGKSMTVRAGVGFAPTVRGDDGAHAAIFLPGSPTSGATFEGLRLERGDITPSFPFEAPAFFLQAWGDASLDSEITLTGCEVLGQFNSGGTGFSTGKATFTDTTFEGPVNLFGFPGSTLEISAEGCTFEQQFVSINGSFGGSVRGADVSLRRCVFEDELGLNAYDGGSLDLIVDSCLVEGGGTEPFGVRVLNDAVGTLTNLTVTGCLTAIHGQPGVSWHNLLLYGNGADLLNVAPGEISDSLISDGTYDGSNGNFAGAVVVDGSYALLACSDGVDAGDNAAPGLGALDLYGAARIADDDGDLVATVNVGAVEALGSVPGSVVISNGSGVNPSGYIAAAAPVAGSNFQAFIPPIPGGGTLLTIVVIDVPIAPVTGSGWVGELLLALSGTAYYHTSSAIHNLPIPANCNLVGVTLFTQGFRLDNAGGVPTVVCLHRLDLTIGG